MTATPSHPIISSFMQDIASFLQSMLHDASALAIDYFHKGVTHTFKSNLSDVVTEADTTIQKLMIDKIQSAYPDHQIHSEELKIDINDGAAFEWILDPLDGTRNFAFGIPLWCHIVGIMKEGEPYMAAVYNPIANELFFAEKGKGATRNGLPIHVSTKETLNYAYGSFSRAGEAGETYGTHIERFKTFAVGLNKETTVWICSLGTMNAACYVASGGYDFFVQNAGLDHDYLAAALICSEAGAVVTDSDSNPWTRERQDIVIANPVLHRKIIELFH